MINVKIFTGLGHHLSQEHLQAQINKWLEKYFEHEDEVNERIVKISQSQGDGTITISIWYHKAWDDC